MDSAQTPLETGAEQRALLALLRAPNVGCQTLRPLLAAAGSAAALIAKPPPTTPDALRAYLREPDWSGVDSDQAWLEQADAHLLVLGTPAYPALLAGIANPPCALFVRGDPALLHLPQLAMVGSRTPSAGGRDNARAFAEHLATGGLTISSGLAEGVDAAAHAGALDATGTTVAVIGTGPDRVYPARHRELAHRIAEHGAIVTEFPVGVPPLTGNFPRRNRIIAGLSLGTLVVEAAARSGSLITARLASEQGREVFAIPGSIHNPLARGCHQLIRDGARLVETGADIIAELAPLLGSLDAMDSRTTAADASVDTAANPDHDKVLQAMGHDPVTTDLLAARTGFSAGEISSILLLLELGGHVSSEPGGRFTRLGDNA